MTHVVTKIFRRATLLLCTHGFLGGFLASFLRLEFVLASLPAKPPKPPVSGDVRTHIHLVFPAVPNDSYHKLCSLQAYTMIKGLPTETPVIDKRVEH